MQTLIDLYVYMFLLLRGMIDPSFQRLEWHSPPQNVLIIKKHHDSDVTNYFKIIVEWLLKVNIFLFIYFD